MPEHPAAAHTRAWVERAVIGLNLCPFAKAAETKGLNRYTVSAATDADALLADLVVELKHIASTHAAQLETTLLIHPQVLDDFADFNDFLDRADAAVNGLGLDGVIQIASFHPRYRFAGTEVDDIGNATNRSPYPTLHLLREASVERAVAAFAQSESIYESNIATLERLGAAGWAELERQCARQADGSSRSADADPNS